MVQYDGAIWEQKFRDAGIRVVCDWSCQKSSRNPLVKVSNLVKRKRIMHARKNNGKGLLDVCLKEHFDIIVSYNVLDMELVGFSNESKSVKYIHGDVATNPIYKRTVLKTGSLLTRFDRIVCVSDVACKSFQELTGICDGVEAHFNPLNSENVHRLSQKEIEIFPKDVPIICAVGRLSKEKGFTRLITIHKRILDKGVPHLLVIVGDGPERNAIIDEIHKTGTDSSVFLTGYRDNPYPYIKQSDFLVVPSYTEGLSVTSMEALCLGIPVVSSVPTVRELFGDEMCGIVTNNDDESLETGIICMLTDTEFYKQAKVAAQRRSSFFEGRQMVKEIEDMFLGLISEGE